MVDGPLRNDECAGSIAAATADRLGAHRQVLIFCYIAAVTLQGAMALVVSFPVQLGLTIIVSTVWTGAPIIGDAAVMAASNAGDYGRLRTWASAAWVAFAPIAGWVNEKYGVSMGIAVYVVGSILALPAAWNLPVDALRKYPPRMTATEATVQGGEEEAGIEGTVEEPLLAPPPSPPFSPTSISPSTQPPSPPPEKRFAKALAIIRFIEAITELGAVPPPGSLYGFAEVATPYAAGHFRPPENGDDTTEWGASFPDDGGRDEVWFTPFSEAPDSDGEPSLSSRIRKEAAGSEIEADEEPFRFGTKALSTARSIPRRPFSSYNGHKLAMGHGYTSDEGSYESRDSEISTQQQGFISRSDIQKDWEAVQPLGLNSQLRVRVHHQHLPAIPSATDLVQEDESIPALEDTVLEEGEGEEVDLETGAPFEHGGEDLESRSVQRKTALDNLMTLFGMKRTQNQEKGAGFTPVQRYLETKWQDMKVRAERRKARALDQGVPVDQLPPSPQVQRGGLTTALEQQDITVPESVKEHVTPDLMQEALEFEAQGIAGNDPTGSLVVAMLGKKLANLVEEEKKNRKRRHQKSPMDEKDKEEVISTVEFYSPLSRGGEPHLKETSPMYPTEHRPMLQETNGAVSTTTPHVESSLRMLFKKPEIVAFFGIATLLGSGHGIIGTFLFLYLKGLGAGESLMGFVLLANALPELPVFYFFGSILRAVGMDTLLITSTFFLAVRLAAIPMLSYEWLPLWSVLPLETIHAVTYAGGWSACAINASKIAPPGLESTTQAMFQGLWTGVGAGLGGLLGGFLYHSMGPECVFLVGAVTIGVGAIAAALVLGFGHYQRRKARDGDYR